MTIKKFLISILAYLILFTTSSAQAGFCFHTSENSVFTLYRSSAITNGESMRIHVASFDASDGEKYNSENCEVAKVLFQNQPGVTVRYWCEKGYFKK